MKIFKLFKFKPTKSKVIKVHYLDDLLLSKFELKEDTRIHHTGKAYKEIHKEVVKANPWLGEQQPKEEISDNIEYNKIYYKKLGDKDKVIAEGTMKFDTAAELDDFIKNPEKYEKYDKEPIIMDLKVSPPTSVKIENSSLYGNIFEPDFKFISPSISDTDIWYPIIEETKVKKNKSNFLKTFINKLRKK